LNLGRPQAKRQKVFYGTPKKPFWIFVCGEEQRGAKPTLPQKQNKLFV
jgi:hypothetical protein